MRVEQSSRKDKKYMAIFKDGSITHFGSAGMDDYTLTRDKEQRDRYRLRHLKDLDTDDPKRAGFLSYFILWGDSPDINKNIAKYKKMFGDL